MFITQWNGTMECDAPLSIKFKNPIYNKETKNWINFFPAGCGKCLPCLKKRKNDWSFRLMEEQRNSFSSKFVTLTYLDRHLVMTDHGPTVNYDDHKKFISKLKQLEKSSTLALRSVISTEELERKANGIEEDGKIKYYGITEYGDQTFRPHWHYLLFNVRDWHNIDLAWGLGKVQLDECNNNTVDYILKYMIKDHSGQDYTVRLPEKSFMSKGIGVSYATEEVRKFIRKPQNNNLVNTRGSKIGLPRYFRKKFVSENARIQKSLYIAEQLKEEKAKKESELKRLGRNVDQVDKQLKDARRHMVKTRKKRLYE